MSYFERFLSDPVSVILIIVLVLYLIKEGFSLYTWYKDRADDYHNVKSDDEKFHKQVMGLVEITKSHTEALQKITETLEDVTEKIKEIETHHDEDMKIEREERKRDRDEVEKERKLDSIANAKAWLYKLYEELKDKPSLTIAEYETFNDLAERYSAAGGNSIFKNKIIPEILNKPVSDHITTTSL